MVSEIISTVRKNDIEEVKTPRPTTLVDQVNEVRMTINQSYRGHKRLERPPLFCWGNYENEKNSEIKELMTQNIIYQ